MNRPRIHLWPVGTKFHSNSSKVVETFQFKKTKKNQPHVGKRVDSNPSAAFEELLAAMCVV